MAALRRAVRAIKSAYGPDGINVGMNLGAAAGAGVPGHLHVHALPRWQGDTNFMTAVAEVRVLPEDLATGWAQTASGLAGGLASDLVLTIATSPSDAVEDKRYADALPEDLDVKAYVGPYLFPDIRRRRIAGTCT